MTDYTGARDIMRSCRQKIDCATRWKNATPIGTCGFDSILKDEEVQRDSDRDLMQALSVRRVADGPVPPRASLYSIDSRGNRGRTWGSENLEYGNR